METLTSRRQRGEPAEEIEKVEKPGVVSWKSNELSIKEQKVINYVKILTPKTEVGR